MKILVCAILLLLTLLLFSSAFNINQLFHDSCLGSRLIEALPVDEPRDRGSRRGISCKDELNRRIPWFIAYKIPKIQDSPIPLVTEGRGYAYLHPELLALKTTWRFSSKGIDDQNSILGSTLRQRSISLWASYNDQYPESTHSGGAHSKGIIMFHAASRTAVWIVHSVPKLPVDSGVTFYPPTGYANGQMMMCMNMPISTLLEVVRRLNKIGPHMQDRHLMPLNLLEAALESRADRDLFLNLGTGVPVQNDNEAPVETMRIVQTDLQQQFKVYFKPPTNTIDLYSDYIAPDRGTHIQVQSWYRGRGGRMCKVVNNAHANLYNVFTCVQDVQTVRIQADDCYGQRVDIQFSSGKDHSKWAVTEEIEAPWVCISDLNRMVSQVKRGGSAICILHPDVWTVFNKTIGGLFQSEVASGSSNYVHDELRFV